MKTVVIVTVDFLFEIDDDLFIDLNKVHLHLVGNIGLAQDERSRNDNKLSVSEIIFKPINAKLIEHFTTDVEPLE